MSSTSTLEEMQLAKTESEKSARILTYSAVIAFLLESAVLTLVAVSDTWFTHPKNPNALDSNRFIEAEVYQPPKEETPKLRSEEPEVKAPKKEAVLSKIADQGKKAKNPDEAKPSESNQTTGGPPLAPTHGPVAVFSPSPSIPNYLRDQLIKTSVVIEFLVTSQGQVTPRLLSSSGNEELDQIALSTAKQWRFRPGEQNHQAIDSKVRLRILFEVK